MKKRYIVLVIFLLLGTILVLTNPKIDDYTAFLTKQVVEKGIEPKVNELVENTDSALVEKIVNFGQGVSDDFVDSTTEKVIDKFTIRTNYYLFSIYDTNIDLIYKEYNMKFIGIGKLFIPLELPKE